MCRVLFSGQFDSWSVSLSGKDLVILALAIMNLATFIVGCIVCCHSRIRKHEKDQWDTESEVVKLNHLQDD